MRIGPLWYLRMKVRLYELLWLRFFGTQCSICDEYYCRCDVRHGACFNCRSVMPLLWVD